MAVEWPEIKILESDGYKEIKNAILGVLNNDTSGYWFEPILGKRFAIVDSNLATKVFMNYPPIGWDKTKDELIKENTELKHKLNKILTFVQESV